MQQGDVVFLDKALLIGEGGHRDVYINPGNPAQCIKVDVKRSHDHYREMRYRRSREFRRLSPSSLMVEYYGAVQTNLGTGYIFERVLDYDGTTSKTLDEIIRLELQARAEKKSIREVAGTEKEIPRTAYILLHFRKILFKENIIPLFLH